MGIYIKGMEMPESCYSCEFRNESGWCPVKRKLVDKYDYETCSLVTVPDHGRLIDADALQKDIIQDMDYYEDVLPYIKASLTIIPADEVI